MTKARKLMMMFVVLLLITCSSTGLPARENITAILKCETTVDVCGSQTDKRVLLTLNIGKVTPQDSLYGFNFELTYDTTKLVFDTPIYTNTLAESATLKDVNFANPGLMDGYAVNYTHLLYGDQPLIAVLGRFKENCPDTTIVNIALLEFIETYKNNVTELQPAVVTGQVTPKPERVLIPKFDKDSVLIDTNKTGKLNIGLNASSGLRLDNLEIKLKLTDTSQVRIDKLSSLTDTITIDNVNYTNDGLTANITYKYPLDYGNQLSLSLTQLNYSVNPCGIIFETAGYNDCSCITDVQNSESLIITKQFDTTGIREKGLMNDFITSSYYDPLSEEFRINTNTIDLYKVSVYNIQGLLIKQKKTELTDIINVDTYGIPKGVYFLKIERQIDDKKNIMLIK